MIKVIFPFSSLLVVIVMFHSCVKNTTKHDTTYCPIDTFLTENQESLITLKGDKHSPSLLYDKNFQLRGLIDDQNKKRVRSYVFHENGLLRYTGIKEDGKKNGEHLFYNELGVISSYQIFYDDILLYNMKYDSSGHPEPFSSHPIVGIHPGPEAFHFGFSDSVELIYANAPLTKVEMVMQQFDVNNTEILADTLVLDGYRHKFKLSIDNPKVNRIVFQMYQSGFPDNLMAAPKRVIEVIR